MPHTLWTTPLPLLSKAIPTMVPTPLPTGGVLINTVYNIGMYKSKHIFHSNAIPVPTWCYRDMNNPIQTYLGPVIEATAGMPVYVTWTNNLPTALPFPYVLPAAPPGTMMMALPKPGHTVTHLHGAHCPPTATVIPKITCTRPSVLRTAPRLRPTNTPTGSRVQLCGITITLWVLHV